MGHRTRRQPHHRPRGRARRHARAEPPGVAARHLRIVASAGPRPCIRRGGPQGPSALMSENREQEPLRACRLARVLDDDACYHAVLARDARFDGWFFSGVRTTGIFCRPSCPARTPHRRNIEFHPTAAAAVRAGFRACLRCRPDTTPGSPEWNLAGDVAARAVRAINDGVVDREGIPGLADRLGYSVTPAPPPPHRRRSAQGRSSSPVRIALRPRGRCSRRRSCRSPRSPSRRASVRRASSTTRSVTSSAARPRRCGTGAARPTRPRGARSSHCAWRCDRRMRRARCSQFLAARAVEGVEEGDEPPTRGRSRLPHAAGVLSVDAPGQRRPMGHLSAARWTTSATSRRRRADAAAPRPRRGPCRRRRGPAARPGAAAGRRVGTPGSACRATSTATRSPSGPCSASR